MLASWYDAPLLVSPGLSHGKEWASNRIDTIRFV